MSFADLGISKAVVRALAKRDITQPFPVQQLVIRDALAGHDLLVQSPTGSGKTLAFGIPLVDRIEPGTRASPPWCWRRPASWQARSSTSSNSIARARNLRIAAVYGGVGFGPQIKAAQRADIIVATPGRLEDLIARGAIDLKRVRVLVLDEADRMLDMGFKPAVEPDRRPDARSSARPSSSRPRWRARPASSPPPTPASRAATPTPRRSDRKAEIEHRFVHVDSQAAKLDHLAGAAARARRRSHAGLRPHQARRRPAGQAPAQPRTGGRRHARRQEPGTARTRARPLRAR